MISPQPQHTSLLGYVLKISLLNAVVFVTIKVKKVAIGALGPTQCSLVMLDSYLLGSCRSSML
jgi:hypothetical protein